MRQKTPLLCTECCTIFSGLPALTILWLYNFRHRSLFHRYYPFNIMSTVAVDADSAFLRILWAPQLIICYSMIRPPRQWRLLGKFQDGASPHHATHPEHPRDIIWEIQHQLTSVNLLERKPVSTQRKSTKLPRLSVCYFE